MRGSGRTKADLEDALRQIDAGRDVIFVVLNWRVIGYTRDLAVSLRRPTKAINAGLQYGKRAIFFRSVCSEPERWLGFHGVILFDHAAFAYARDWDYRKWMYIAQGCNVRFPELEAGSRVR